MRPVGFGTYLEKMKFFFFPKNFFFFGHFWDFWGTLEAKIKYLYIQYGGAFVA